MGSRVPDSVRRLGDRQWLEMLLKSIHSREVDGMQFPGFPPPELQTEYVGNANEVALKEAFRFYQLIKRSASRFDVPVGPGTRLLDFGCGWGRYLRFFMKDIDEENLHGCDVSKNILGVCRDTGVPGNLAQIQPTGKLPFPDAHFGVVLAYSVFTHLPESEHLHWMREIARVMRPGGMFCLTLEPRRFIDYIGTIKPDQANTSSEWARLLSSFKPRIPEFHRRFDAGELVFMPTNPGVEATYGDAVVPLSYVERAWASHFEVKQYIDDSKQFWQAALVVRRNGGKQGGWLGRLLG